MLTHEIDINIISVLLGERRSNSYSVRSNYYLVHSFLCKLYVGSDLNFFAKQITGMQQYISFGTRGLLRNILQYL